ncbi:hypoxanthine phosphoribosyltransferase [Pelotomaculum terephthalicicum JT]|uniref:hypoxanthine phosphoribosyltransferase n=1 Tax=Pelotomaculum TaxID=191373 RepID=UPI0009C5BEDA|nr:MULTISPECIES: hypoxanthine phosphoribosyltransferase [Pelotomaculum]MCG9966676.1 hypoxanthine phosphoribosyltransferase [Pelotomaculum terephthalicicum JT]OPX91465.1 MAG: Hypoxanthine-guanine phosphoribosyltransferase [Pelotomaculum sp. PtaB.Bin117]OPY63003.1 MAG: Hypoxanthine-guanine phosphoribosyltransferase [Pelotomaculum sp. PtaU1.Bin065]
MHPDGEKILLTEEQLELQVAELGRRISQDYAGKEILVVGILKGAMVFLADLVRKITVPTYFDFISVSSYGSSTKSSGVVRILKDLDRSITGRHVLIVEDIIDTGLTLNYLLENLSSRHPASIKLCALLDKPSRRLKPANINIDYCGFTIPDEFVVGYGLDYNERYRNLPYIMILSPKIYGGGKQNVTA